MPDLSAAQLIIGFLLLLTPVVFFHELGHYWVARRAGVVVEVFSVGFGPEIYGWTSRSTARGGVSRRYPWRLCPDARRRNRSWW